MVFYSYIEMLKSFLEKTFFRLKSPPKKKSTKKTKLVIKLRTKRCDTCCEDKNLEADAEPVKEPLRKI